ncbi:unnamed protein product [Psylliodes chrysocephalus]|uniref:Uncharacterized protein n=1 Tax=Psylliodes chrysocephalus TaxID=3402493 RepID=A0A9P0CLA2_9CUCU|nr:unnamed protein product [Psylliodes chrysocephala]
MIKQSPRPESVRRKRVGIGSEVLTSQDVLEHLQKTKDGKQLKIQNIVKSRCRKKEDISSNDEDEEEKIEYIELDNEGEFLQNIVQESEIQDREENELNQEEKEMKWVLVKYTSKKNTKHYVGRVTRRVEDEWEVKFLKRISTKQQDTIRFDWPPADDIDTVNEADIALTLPEPLEDRRGLLYFIILFDGFNI